MGKTRRIYAAYRGDKYIGEGTLREIAAMTGLKVETVIWYTTPAGKRRMGRHKEHKRYPRLTLVDLGDK